MTETRCTWQADWKEGFKKKQAGVSDMTLLSTISNDSVNENLKKRSVCTTPLSSAQLTSLISSLRRFENAEIYVSQKKMPNRRIA